TGSPAPVRSSAGPSQVPPASAPRAAAPQAPQGPLAPQQNQELQTVALVNGEAISRQQLANEAVRRFGKEVLESLVNKHLILQACQKQKISVTNQDVETEIERMSAKFGLSKDKWLEMLQGERN